MTAVAAVTATFQAVIVVLLWRRSKQIGGGHLAAMFATAWFLFSGLARLTLAVSPVRWTAPTYNTVTVASLDRWMLWSTAQLAVFAICVRLWWRRRAQLGTERTARSFSLRPITARRCAFALVPLFPALIYPSSSFVGGLAVQYGLFIIALGVIDLSLRRPQRTLWYVAAGCGLMSLFGQRLQVVSIAILSLGALLWMGQRTERRRLVGVGLAVVIVLAAIAGGRQSASRQVLTQSSVKDRTDALFAGISAGFSGSNLKAQLDEVSGRVDSNGFGTVLLRAQEDSGLRIGLTTVKNSLMLSVPSFAYGAKLDRPEWERNEKGYIIRAFDLPIYQDSIPGWTSVTAWWGPLAASGILGLFGMALAALDLWLRQRSVVRLVVGLHVAYGLCLFERGPEGCILTLRGALPLLLIYGYLKILYLGARKPLRPGSFRDQRRVARPAVSWRE